MHTTTSAMLVLALSGLLVGCDRNPVESVSRPPTLNATQSTPSTNVAAPTGDPSLPPASAALLSPKAGTDVAGDSTLTRTERATQMPMPGQANDHSSPAFAKRGDASAPAKTAN